LSGFHAGDGKTDAPMGDEEWGQTGFGFSPGDDEIKDVGNRLACSFIL